MAAAQPAQHPPGQGVNGHLDHDRPRQERVKCVVVGKFHDGRESGVGKIPLFGVLTSVSIILL